MESKRKKIGNNDQNICKTDIFKNLQKSKILTLIKKLLNVG